MRGGYFSGPFPPAKPIRLGVTPYLHFFYQTSMNAFLSATVCTSVKILTVDTAVAVTISSKWTLRIPKTVYVSEF